jgi:hypothetical protein
VATHDYVIANGTGAAVRSDLNGALAAIVSNNSSATQPATMYAYQWWADTTTGLLKIRNSANSAWVTLFELDGTLVASDISLGAGTVGAPSLFFTGDPNTGIYSPGADQLAISTNGTGALFVDALGRVGIGAVPTGARFDIRGGSGPYMYIVDSGANGGAFVAEATNSVVNVGSTYLGSSAVPLAFLVGGSERARIDNSGRLLVGTATQVGNVNGGILQLGSGITFPATAVAASDANTLDDYEEGTWTPTQGAGLTVVGTFTSNGHYTKVGRQVTVQGYVSASTSVAAAANSILCAGLPFQVMNVTGSNFIGGGSNAGLTALMNVWASQVTYTLYAVTSMTATGSIYFTISYFTA